MAGTTARARARRRYEYAKATLENFAAYSYPAGNEASERMHRKLTAEAVATAHCTGRAGALGVRRCYRDGGLKMQKLVGDIDAGTARAGT